MEASEFTPTPVEPITAPTPEPVAAPSADPIAAATELLLATHASVTLTAGGGAGAALPETKFPRLSLARRVLGHVTDEVDETAYGPRNTLAALTRGLMMDAHTTNPQNPECEKLDVSGALADTVGIVHEQLAKLEEAGLVEQHPDGSYHVTDAGHTELAS